MNINKTKEMLEYLANCREEVKSISSDSARWIATAALDAINLLTEQNHALSEEINSLNVTIDSLSGRINGDDL